MILAAGLTPAWQQILQFERLDLGAVNRAEEAMWCASGKVLNVGIALAHLEGESRTLCLIGGAAGAAIEREFAQCGYPVRWVQSATPTRVCTTLIDRQQGTITELVENSAAVSATEQQTFLEAFRDESAAAELSILSGSLPQDVPKTFYRDLVAASSGPVVLDIRGEELLATLPFRPFVVKPNRHELEQTLGRSLADDAAVLSALRELNSLGVQWVLMTQGADAVWAVSAEEAFRVIPPRVKTVNAIGCGDCLTAALAWSWCREHDMVESLRFAVAAAVDNLQQILPARLSHERIAKILPTVTIERL